MKSDEAQSLRLYIRRERMCECSSLVHRRCQQMELGDGTKRSRRTERYHGCLVESPHQAISGGTEVQPLSTLP
jgi:hypothetical protein